VPDPATHILVPLTGLRLFELINRKFHISGPVRYLFTLGCFLPHLLDKLIPYSWNYCIRFLEFLDVIDRGKYYFPSLEFIHTPAVLLLFVYIVSFAFVAEKRRIVFRSLSIGVFFHLLLDAIQGNVCDIGYLWFFPFSFEKPNIVRLFYDDQSVVFLPVSIMIYFSFEILYKYMYQKR